MPNGILKAIASSSPLSVTQADGAANPRKSHGRANLGVDRLRARLAELAPEVKLDGDRKVIAVLSEVANAADFSDDARKVTGLLDRGYLASAPRL